MPEVATLNSVDFRFLLPSQRPGSFERVVLLGGIPGMAERLIETDTAVAVRSSTRARQRADAVIVMGHERPDLRDVADGLQPGGVLYFHIRHVPLLSSRARTRRLRRALAEVGLVLVATYAMRPDSASPRVYIPLEAPGALLWYLRTLHWMTDPRSWLVNKTLITIGNAHSRVLSSLVPDIAVVARKPAPGDPAMPMTGTSLLSDPQLGHALGTNDLHALVISGQRTVMFPFGRESAEPLAAIKVPKLASQNRATENGQQALADIEQRLDPAIASSVPKPLLLLHWRGISVAVESVIPGHSLARTFDTWRSPLSVKIEGLRDAARWLGNFHSCTQVTRSPWGSEEIDRWLTIPTDLYRGTFGEIEREHDLFERARGCAVSVSGLLLPIVRQHRDFRPVNIIRNKRGQIAVVDWEGYRAGPAFCDLFHFLIQWHQGARHLNTEAAVTGVERLLFEPIEDPVGHVIHEVVVKYLSDLRLHSALVPLLILYTLLELAIRSGERQLREHGGTDLRRGNENVEFLGALASHREELFGRPRAGSLLQRLSEACSHPAMIPP